MSFESDLVIALHAKGININPSVVPSAAVFSSGIYGLQVWFQSLSQDSASAFDDVAGGLPTLHLLAQPGIDIAPGLYNFFNAIDSQPNRINISDLAAVSVQALGAAAIDPSTLLPPTITGQELKPKTLQHGAEINVSWSSARSYDAWNIRWDGVQSDEQDYTGRSGSYTCGPLVPKQQYSIIVQGGENAGWGHNWSGWSAPLLVAIENYHSLRQFLLASNFNGAEGLRKISVPLSFKTLLGI